MPRFVDTNILVYAEDVDAGDKHVAAKALVIDCWEAGDGVVSTQVLLEFFVTVTRKLKKPLKSSHAGKIVDQYLNWRVIESTRSLLKEAINLSESSKLAFWDALIVQAAIEAGCEALYSEDLNDRQRFGPLQVINPFRHQ